MIAAWRSTSDRKSPRFNPVVAAAVCGIQRDLSKAGRESVRKRVLSQTVSRNQILSGAQIPTTLPRFF